MKLFILIMSLFLSPLAAIAQTDEEIGLAIATELSLRDDGFEDSTVSLEMVLKNRRGDTSKRILRTRTLEVAGDGDKSLVVFDNPRDVKGTAFLNYTHKTGQDDQWLFLPALKRTKRISSSNKSGPFMGSEFAYEDIASQEVEKYTYKWLSDEICGKQHCYEIERYPLDPNSGYTRQLVWIDKDEYRIWKIDFYDRKDSLLKTLTYKGYKQYLKKYWRASEMFMYNHQTGKSTLLVWNNYRFRVGLKESDFSKNSLRRAK